MKTLKDEVFHVAHKGQVKQPGILLLGAVGAGKSSFINSVASWVKCRISLLAHTAPRGKTSKTKKYGCHTVCALDNCKMYDTMGFEGLEDQGFRVDDLMHLIQGNVPNNYQFDSGKSITEETPGYIKNPKAEDRTYCVVFVVAADDLIGGIAMEWRNKIGKLQNIIDDVGIPRVVLLTKVDLVSDTVRKNITQLFNCPTIGQLVEQAAELFQVQPGHVHPIQNYNKETEIKPEMNIPLMYALRQIIHFTYDHLESLL